jgi:Putative Flp pilus-assembly TadE/G-like/von Willebrand factor type A domain
MRKLNQKGSILIFLTLAFALLGTFIGFAVDFGRAYLEKARIARLVDAAALAAAKVLKGQADYEDEATLAACDSMVMNGAPVVKSGGNTCTAVKGAPFTVTLNFFDKAVGGGPAMKHVQVTGTEPMPTTFLRFLGWMVPGPNDFSKIDVAATAAAAPERPIDLMLVLDRSGSMGEMDDAGHTKIDALKCALTGKDCDGEGFLGENFTAADRIGMTSFGKRGCGTGGSGEFTGDVCVPNKVLGSTIDSIVTAIDDLGLSGTTNTMEGLRTGKTEIAKAFADPTRTVTRKVVLLVTDGQPTALRLDSINACEHNPLNTSAALGGPAWTDGTGCYFVKKGTSKNETESNGLDRMTLNNALEHSFTQSTPPVAALYLNQMHAARNAAREEARQIRELGDKNVIIFVIAIGPTTHPDATARLDANARCLLSAIANDQTMLENPSADPGTGSCNAIPGYTTPDGDDHSDLKGANKPIFNPDHQRGKVYTVDLNGDVQTQLQVIFNEIAALLKLRLVI